MGTRCLTRVFENGVQLMNMYRQYDGYPTGHGTDLFEFIKDIEIVDGIGSNDTRKIADGAGCLAAQIVAHFKDGPGKFYLVDGKPGDHGQDYEYQIHVSSDESECITVVVRDYKKKQIFRGNVKDFGEFCKKDDD